MREIFKSGSVGRAPGNRCLYLEPDRCSAAATHLPVKNTFGFQFGARII
jgi:hypothetical protein